MGVGGAPASYVLPHNGDVYERGGKNRAKIIIIAVLKERKIASSYHQSILDPPGYHHIEM